MSYNGQHIHMQKYEKVGEPIANTPDWDDHNEGQFNPNQSLPVSYSLRGYVMGDIEEGVPITVRRYQRNNTRKQGITTTSKVQSINDYGHFLEVKTQNSLYKIKLIDDGSSK